MPEEMAPMTFKHKLSRRLALLKETLVLVAFAAVACEKPLAVTDPTGTISLLISPKTVTLATNGTTQLTAVALTTTGDTANIGVNWSVTGGSITDTSTNNGRHYGRYKAGADTGKFKVIARGTGGGSRSEEHTSELQSRTLISYAV